MSEIAAKIGNGINHNSVISNCTRGLGFNGGDNNGRFIQAVENRTIKEILKSKYPNRNELIDKKLNETELK